MGTPAATLLNNDDLVPTGASTPAVIPSSMVDVPDSSVPQQAQGPPLPHDQFPPATETVPATAFAHAWNALLLNRGHRVWGCNEPLPPIVTGLMFMTSRRAKFGSTLTQEIAKAVHANSHLQPILLKLTSSASRWPQNLHVLTKQGGKFPQAGARAGVNGTISRIPELTLQSVDYSYDLSPGSLTSALRSAFLAMRAEQALPLSQCLPGMQPFLRHPDYDIVTPKLQTESLPNGFDSEQEDSHATITGVNQGQHLPALTSAPHVPFPPTPTAPAGLQDHYTAFFAGLEPPDVIRRNRLSDSFFGTPAHVARSDFSLTRPPASDILVPIQRSMNLRSVFLDSGVKPAACRAALRCAILLAGRRAGLAGTPILAPLPDVIRLQTDLAEIAGPHILEEARTLLDLVAAELDQDVEAQSAYRNLTRLTGHEGSVIDSQIANGWLAAASGASRPCLLAFTAFLLSSTTCMDKKDKLKECKFDEDTREDVAGVLAVWASMKGEASAVLSHVFGLPGPSLGTVQHAVKKLMKQSSTLARAGIEHTSWHLPKSMLDAVSDLLSPPLYVVLLSLAFSETRGTSKANDGLILTIVTSVKARPCDSVCRILVTSVCNGGGTVASTSF